ncbi:hypothetical protein BH23ACT10_BH23ACT10_07360 [soil metagenome]
MGAGPRREPRWSNQVDTPTPVRGQRLSGDHWWDPDRIAHADDAPQYCPACGGSLDGPGSIAVEYWQGANRTYHTRCDRCSWTGDITTVERMIGHEAPH